MQHIWILIFAFRSRVTQLVQFGAAGHEEIDVDPD